MNFDDLPNIDDIAKKLDSGNNKTKKEYFHTNSENNALPLLSDLMKDIRIARNVRNSIPKEPEFKTYDDYIDTEPLPSRSVHLITLDDRAQQDLRKFENIYPFKWDIEPTHHDYQHKMIPNIESRLSHPDDVFYFFYRGYTTDDMITPLGKFLGKAINTYFNTPTHKMLFDEYLYGRYPCELINTNVMVKPGSIGERALNEYLKSVEINEKIRFISMNR